MSIASRQAGALVACPTCGRQTPVPEEDQFAAEDESTGRLDAGEGEEAQESPERQSERLDERRDQSAAGMTPADARQAVAPRRELSPPAATYPEPAQREPEERFSVRKVATDFGGEMDLTPMVDVTFLLLIFFMVTASFSLQKSIEVPPPDPEQEGAMQSVQSPQDLQENAVIVQVDERNAISIDYEPVGAAENLAELLADRRRKQQKSELVIDAAAGASHGTVVMVNDAAIEAQFQRIRLAVRAGDSN